MQRLERGLEPGRVARLLHVLAVQPDLGIDLRARVKTSSSTPKAPAHGNLVKATVQVAKQKKGFGARSGAKGVPTSESAMMEAMSALPVKHWMSRSIAEISSRSSAFSPGSFVNALSSDSVRRSRTGRFSESRSMNSVCPSCLFTVRQTQWPHPPSPVSVTGEMPMMT